MKKRTKPRDKRVWSQAVSALAINAWLPNWLTGRIFQGNIKGFCVPVLNCYSCPSALGACPVGAMQTMMGGLRFNLSVGMKKFGLYVVGLMGISGSIAGRWTCGWLCPFGFLQELMYKIPTPKIKFPKFLSYARYAFLVVMVIILPVLIVDQFGYGQTWFCKWVCPAGTLEAGIPLVLLNKGLRGLVGFMYYWKIALLFLFLGLMTISRRPFCRAVCPLGAFLGLFNKVSFFRMVVDDEKCIHCGTCRKDCPVDHRIDAAPNSPDCIRCLRCVSKCKYGAVSYDFLGRSSRPVESLGGAGGTLQTP